MNGTTTDFSGYGNEAGPLQWSLDVFERNALIHTPEFQVEPRAKKTTYPFRMLRYWFMYHLINRESALQRRPLDVCEIGVDSGQIKLFMGGRNTVPAPRRWDAAACLRLYRAFAR